jgi:hypothetical protein
LIARQQSYRQQEVVQKLGLKVEEGEYSGAGSRPSSESLDGANAMRTLRVLLISEYIRKNTVVSEVTGVWKTEKGWNKK